MKDCTYLPWLLGSSKSLYAVQPCSLELCELAYRSTSGQGGVRDEARLEILEQLRSATSLYLWTYKERGCSVVVQGLINAAAAR